MAEIFNFSGLSCTDGQIYPLYMENPPSNLEKFKAYSGENGHYFALLTSAYSEQDTSGIKIASAPSYVGCYTTPGYSGTYYYRANQCNSGPVQNVIVSSFIPNLHNLNWIVRDTANPTVCLDIIAPTATVSGNPITKTFANCSDCSNNYSTQPLTASTGGYTTVQEPCFYDDSGVLFTWGNNPSPAVGEPLFLDADTVKPFSGGNLYYSTNWTSPPKSLQISNAGTITSIADCVCYFDAQVSEKAAVPVTPVEQIKQCVANMEFIIRYGELPSSGSPCFGGHSCNFAVFFLTGNGVRITGGTISDEAVWLNNYGGPLDKLNYPPGVTSGYDRYNKLTADTATSQAIANTSTDGYITFSLDCAVKALGLPTTKAFPTGCHTNVTWITMKLNGKSIYDECPNGNFVTINPCTGKVINTTS